MAITSYETLRDAVAGSANTSWTHRTDILANFDTFLALCEEEIYSGPPGGEGLRVKEMETTDASASTSTSVRTLAHPTGYLEYRKLQLSYSGAYFPPLDYRTPQAMWVYDTVGRPCYYTLTSQIEFERVSDVAYTVNRVYYAKLTAISSSNSTNTILTNYPSIYLHGVLSHVWVWAMNQERAQLHRDLFAGAIRKANSEDRWGRVGTQPTMVLMEPIL